VDSGGGLTVLTGSDESDNSFVGSGAFWWVLVNSGKVLVRSY
jgi:hypothetical protein